MLLWQLVLRQENVIRLAAEVLYNFYMSRENMFYTIDVRFVKLLSLRATPRTR